MAAWSFPSGMLSVSPLALNSSRPTRHVLSVVVPVRDLGQWPQVVRNICGAGNPGELILQAGSGIAECRNRGAAKAAGDVLLFSDDDVTIQGDFGYFSDRPESEAWWVALRWTDYTGDEYTETVCRTLNFLAPLSGILASVGSFQAVRRSAFEAVGGYDTGSVHEDHALARALHRKFGLPAVAPFEVGILRRTVTVAEHWERHFSSPQASAPYEARRFRFTYGSGPGSRAQLSAPGPSLRSRS